MKKLFLLLSLLVINYGLLFAAEEITITTYYPSPYGIYKDLTATHNMYVGYEQAGYPGVGDGNYGAKLHFTGAPDISGGWNNTNSDPLWISRFNVADDQTELRVSIGDNIEGDASSIIDSLVIGSSVQGAGGAWRPKVTVRTDGRVTIVDEDPDTTGLRGLVLDRYTSDAYAPQVNFRKARGTSTAPAGVIDNDRLGHISFRGYDKTAFSNSGAIRAYAEGDWSGTNHGTHLAFETTPLNSTTIAERMRINSEGYVGIGTNAPRGRLDVNSGSSATDALFVKASPGVANQGGIIHHQGSTGIRAWQEVAQDTGTINPLGGRLVFNYVTNADPGSKITRDVFVLKGDGTVSIGGTPAHMTVESDSTISIGSPTTPSMVLNKGKGNVTSANGKSDLWFSVNGGIAAQNSMYFFTDSDNNQARTEFQFRSNAENSNSLSVPVSTFLMTIEDESGTPQVGIGVANPTYQLELATDSAYKSSSGSWAFGSDIRVKKNVKPINHALERLLELQGRQFEWANPEEHGNLKIPRFGFIAQEAEKVFPDWFSEVEAQGKDKKLVKDGKMKTINIFGFEALAVEAIRELKAENDALKNRIALLEKKIDK